VKKPEVIVTGGRGFIGSHLLRALAGSSFDLRDGNDVRTDPLPSGDVVVHLAAQADVQSSIADAIYDATTNIIGTLAVLEQARHLGFPVIVVGSGGTFGKIASPYGLSKATAVQYSALYRNLYGTRTRELMLPNVHGVGSRSVIEVWALDPVGAAINGDGEQTREFVHVSSVVNELSRMVENLDYDPGSVPGRRMSINELWDETFPHRTRVYRPSLPGEVRWG